MLLKEGEIVRRCTCSRTIRIHLALRCGTSKRQNLARKNPAHVSVLCMYRCTCDGEKNTTSKFHCTHSRSCDTYIPLLLPWFRTPRGQRRPYQRTRGGERPPSREDSRERSNRSHRHGSTRHETEAEDSTTMTYSRVAANSCGTADDLEYHY